MTYRKKQQPYKDNTDHSQPIATEPVKQNIRTDTAEVILKHNIMHTHNEWANKVKTANVNSDTQWDNMHQIAVTIVTKGAQLWTMNKNTI